LEGRSRILFPLTASYRRDRRPLARALLFGDKRALGPAIRRRFRDAGLAHLLALSGLHVGLFLLLMRRLLTVLAGRPSRAEWGLMLLLPFLSGWGGGGASIHRAVSMAAYVLVSRRLGGRPLAMETLAFAACVELCFHPSSLFEPGFQLSYLATMALFAFPVDRLSDPPSPGRRLAHLVREGMALSALCTLATLPVILTRFGRLPLGGPVWNLLAGPWTAASLFAGWVFLPFGKIHGALLIPGFFFGGLLKLTELAGSQWRLTLTGFAVPGWAWLPWGWGMRGLLSRRSRISWVLPLVPILAGWIRGDGGWTAGPSSF